MLRKLSFVIHSRVIVEGSSKFRTIQVKLQQTLPLCADSRDYSPQYSVASVGKSDGLRFIAVETRIPVATTERSCDQLFNQISSDNAIKS